MMPAFLSSAAMRCVEYPGRSMTNVCPEGSTGVSRAQANHPAFLVTTISISQRSLRTLFTIRHSRIRQTQFR